MSDSPLEEIESREHAEHAEHAARSGDVLISQVTMTIAVLAVVAAIAASLETTEGDRTIVAKNDAVLAQNRATDAWNFFQAKSLKKNLYQLAADLGGAKAKGYVGRASSNAAQEAQIGAQAQALEAERNRWSAVAEAHELRHGRLTIASTLLHMAIAIATLSIILRRRWPWLAALALTGAGLVIGAWAYL
ncbi:MAG: DUF4337 family protein [Caulobacteraceae bacterium]